MSPFQTSQSLDNFLTNDAGTTRTTLVPYNVCVDYYRIALSRSMPQYTKKGSVSTRNAVLCTRCLPVSQMYLDFWTTHLGELDVHEVGDGSNKFTALVCFQPVPLFGWQVNGLHPRDCVATALQSASAQDANRCQWHLCSLAVTICHTMAT